MLGLDPVTERDLLYIAKEGIKAPLPTNWKPVYVDIVYSGCGTLLLVRSMELFVQGSCTIIVLLGLQISVFLSIINCNFIWVTLSLLILTFP